jgi:hypothetical protein
VSQEFSILRGTAVPPAFIRSLAKAESNSIGFLADEALDWYAHNGVVIGGLVNDDPTCFALGKAGSSTYPDTLSLYMTAVRTDARRFHHASRLIDQLRHLAVARSLEKIQLWCRGDLEAHELWAHVGMTPVAVRSGGTGRNVPHVCWILPLNGQPVTADHLSTRRRGRAGPPQPIVREATTADVLDVIRRAPADLLSLTLPAAARPSLPPQQLSLFDTADNAFAR